MNDEITSPQEMVASLQDSVKLRPLLLSSNDIHGGAARAAFRLHDGLRQIGTKSKLLVQNKESDRASVLGPRSSVERGWAKVRPHLDNLPLKLYRNRQDTAFHVQWLPDGIDTTVHDLRPDVVHLHSICYGFLQVETIASFDRPIVWTLHDMWAMTGGCHYSGPCDGYKSNCGSCPQLGSNASVDLSRITWLRKRRAWDDLDITIVAPSRWLAECAQSSSLFESCRIEVIPYGLDLDVYKPIDTEYARHSLNLPQDTLLVLFGAVNATSNPRKGYNLLIDALSHLSGNHAKSIELVVFGSSGFSDEDKLPFRTHYLGNFSDDVALAQLYNAADVFVAPSRQDNLPLTVQESLACGTPVVAFDIGGMKDMIQHNSNGYLAKPFDAHDLAHGVEKCLSDNNSRNQLSKSARGFAEEKFSRQRQARQYAALYQELCQMR